ncbi:MULTISPECIES: hypothetical protein [Asticcacaulis]|uniref:hypothetical protein n=1 Tax=Asticcacaulis TaxID=76890 RepID=UPI001AE16E6F|nr:MULTISPECIES: hypothetical protein [Asticcacaulis]MBP2161863.1 hypothetical protein [Asticcacaulis solisilvae]MDR6802895.1 hypothetical protein [Asticcacaulis sp. BE141]
MLRISETQTAAFNAEARRQLTLQLSDDLTNRFPETFGFMEPVEVVEYVQRRIDFAISCDITRQDHIAELAMVEAMTDDDFTNLAEDHWAYDVLHSSRDAGRKITMLRAPLNDLEVDPEFEPSEFD